MLRMIGNLLWFVFCGLWLGLAWWLTGILMFILIITIPWAKSAFVLGQFSFLPFGRTLIDRAELSGREDIGTGTFGLIGNIIWFLLAGIWLAIVNVVAGVAWCLTIIGIPFGIQCFKLAGASVAPIGKTVVSNELADRARMNTADKQFHDLRSRE